MPSLPRLEVPAVVEGQVPSLGDELMLRAERLRASDPVAAARAFVELGVHEERIAQDRGRARAAYEAARALVPGLEPALPRVRRLLEGRATFHQQIGIIDEELGIAVDDALRADLLAERARLCEALGELAEARSSYAHALRVAPYHAASLRGLEATLRKLLAAPDLPETKTRELAEALASHLERVGDAVRPNGKDGDAHLAAWVHVERANVLDGLLAQDELAMGALLRAVAFEPAPGPVRDALNRHLVLHGRTQALAESLVVEAEQERDGDRAARLLYFASRLFTDKLDMPMAASHHLLRALDRAPEESPTARHIMAELIRLLESSGEMAQSAAVRQRRLRLLTDPDAIAHEHVRLCEIFDQLGAADQSAFHAERALEIFPEEQSTRERLDRALQRLGRHDERVRAWIGEANATRPVAVRVRALLRAADIADRHLRRRDEAIVHLRGAWSIDPGNTEVFDALSALLAPPSRDPEQDGRGVRARIELYQQAASAAKDAARKIGLYEKLVTIWEDELGLPARAIEDIEKILALEPGRRSAILALQRNAERAGDSKAFARALLAEADLTEDRTLRRKLLLRAAEVLLDRIGDRDRALQTVESAIAIDPLDVDALRARHKVLEKSGRCKEARATLLQLIGRESDDGKRFSLWIEVARLDEGQLKQPYDAVDAYGQAALVKPRHPIPPREISRLLRALGDPAKLVESLMALAGNAADSNEYVWLLFQAAEVQELLLGDDEAALKCFIQADAIPDVPQDPALLEGIERIYVRRKASSELAALYARWLERQPPATVDHKLRIALGGVLADRDATQAAVLLEGLLGVVPNHVPALRMLEQIHRRAAAHAALAGVLRAQADVVTSGLARCGGLWELVSLEEQIGGAATIDALGRIIVDAPRDAAAHDAIIRIASKLTTGVAVPHPAALATRARLVPAIQARRELCRDAVACALYQIEEAILTEAFAPEDHPGAARAALAGFQAALVRFPESLLAARSLERLAHKLGDRSAIVESQVALARLVEGASFRAQHLVNAAALLAEDPARSSEALPLYDEALRVDADCVPAATALARLLASEPPRLVDRLGAALERATFVDQVVQLGNEIGAAVLRVVSESGAGIDPNLGINAMRRVLEVAPEDATSLLLMARLLVAQRVWSEARETLLRVIESAPSTDQRIAAHFLLTDVYEGPLADAPRAIESLQAVLTLDGGNRRALERLHAVATKSGDTTLAIQALQRLADVVPDAASRVEVDLRIAEACREAGDAAGRVRALADAVASLPSDGRALAALARLYRVDTPEGAGGYAAALQQIIDIAAARHLAIESRWLVTLGLLEVTVLVRPREGLAHLHQAVALPGSPPDARVALGRGLEAAGRNAEAVQVLRDVVTNDPEVFARLGGELAAALAALEAALAKEGRVEERLAVEEVRACMGEVKADRVARLRARRAGEGSPYAGALAGAEIARDLLPDARSPLIDVALAISPIAAKVLRFELGNLGVASRDRLNPREGHPTRAIADRLARALGLERFEIYLSPTWQGAARVYPGDPPMIVGPTSFAELPENEQAYALARLLTRIALGLAYLDELAVEALDGLLLASVRQVDPGFGAGEISASRDSMATSFNSAVRSAIGRRQRNAIEEIQAALTASYDARAFAIGVRRSEYRIGYLLTGDLVSAIDYLRRFDREIARSNEEPRVLLQHPVTNELLRFALTAEAHAERRRLGTVWSGA